MLNIIFNNKHILKLPLEGQALPNNISEAQMV